MLAASTSVADIAIAQAGANLVVTNAALALSAITVTQAQDVFDVALSLVPPTPTPSLEPKTPEQVFQTETFSFAQNHLLICLYTQIHTDRHIHAERSFSNDTSL